MAKVSLPVNFDINLHLQADYTCMYFKVHINQIKGILKPRHDKLVFYTELLCKNWSCLLNDDEISSNLHFLKIIIMAF